MLYFLTSGEATGDVATGTGMLSTIVMLVIMVAVFYFMLIRPENKRKKEAAAMRDAVRVGDKITTIGGIVGVVVNIKDDKFVIESGADQVRVEFCKWALSTNETAAEAKQAAQKKALEERATAKAAKKAEKKEKQMDFGMSEVHFLICHPEGKLTCPGIRGGSCFVPRFCPHIRR